jgi:hypothetical protein
MAFLLPEIILAVTLRLTKVTMRLLLKVWHRPSGSFKFNVSEARQKIFSYIITILKNGSANLRENNVPKQKPQNTFISEIVSE